MFGMLADALAAQVPEAINADRSSTELANELPPLPVKTGIKVYIAHNFAAAAWLKSNAVPMLEAAGIECTSSWITETSTLDQKIEAHKDLDDIDRANCFLFFAGQEGHTPGRGKYLELGYAMNKHRNISGQLAPYLAMIDNPLSQNSARDGDKWNCVFLALIPEQDVFDSLAGWIERVKSIFEFCVLCDGAGERLIRYDMNAKPRMCRCIDCDGAGVRLKASGSEILDDHGSHINNH